MVGHDMPLTQDMLNELNKASGLPGYEHYLDAAAAAAAAGHHDVEYDLDDGWNNDRYYAGSGGQRYKVKQKPN
jgi:2-methylcitrate dehydratase PrpD